MSWSLVIVDDGITNRLQSLVGKTSLAEYDYARGVTDTDEGFAATHGNLVVQSALAVSRAYDVIDLKVGAPDDPGLSSGLIEAALLDTLNSPEYTIGAINMSFSSLDYPFAYADEISQLAARGILCVASSSNNGTHAALERSRQPGALPDVISVGSHDGNGRPSAFSNNGPGVDLLADGEDMPRAGIDGTSFAAPRVAATVTHVQAIVDGLTGEVLGTVPMIDVLQLGGAGPRSRPDPADGHTRYFLHDHASSLDYAWSHYGGSPTKALEYVASYQDLIQAIGANADAGRVHFENWGSIEQRQITFDANDYIASYGDLIQAFGDNRFLGATHYVVAGQREGRAVDFDGLDYIASYNDLIGAYGANDLAGSTHFIARGYAEGRQTTFDGLDYIASYRDLITAIGANEDAGAVHFITAGIYENRAPDLFDAGRYLANYADLRIAFGADEEAATQHFIVSGYFEGRTDDAVSAASDFMI